VQETAASSAADPKNKRVPKVGMNFLILILLTAKDNRDFYFYDGMTKSASYNRIIQLQFTHNIPMGRLVALLLFCFKF
jgi:hypothetical protein